MRTRPVEVRPVEWGEAAGMLLLAWLLCALAWGVHRLIGGGGTPALGPAGGCLVWWVFAQHRSRVWPALLAGFLGSAVFFLTVDVLRDRMADRSTAELVAAAGALLCAVPVFTAASRIRLPLVRVKGSPGPAVGAEAGLLALAMAPCSAAVVALAALAEHFGGVWGAVAVPVGGVLLAAGAARPLRIHAQAPRGRAWAAVAGGLTTVVLLVAGANLLPATAPAAAFAGLVCAVVFAGAVVMLTLIRRAVRLHGWPEAGR
ncbi:hypothetical protein [Peterkaempfera bronchialis]|uniref:hypothetical protein n=1 Tax=Peterkaempfera bronchialis TaxID=2126346 RepID=UPI0013B378B7|nr:hypothetical protein [Peterkaempfera bronchialis]